MDQEESKRYSKIYDIMGQFDGYSVAEAQGILRDAAEFIASTSRFRFKSADVHKAFVESRSNPSGQA